MAGRVGPGDLPDGAFVTFKGGLEAVVISLRINLEDFDGAIRGAGGKATTIEVELGVVDGVGVCGIDGGFGRNLFLRDGGG